jgi:hypothetical protein
MAVDELLRLAAEDLFPLSTAASVYCRPDSAVGAAASMDDRP